MNCRKGLASNAYWIVDQNSQKISQHEKHDQLSTASRYLLLRAAANDENMKMSERQNDKHHLTMGITIYPSF
jgi:hypothetical protein